MPLTPVAYLDDDLLTILRYKGKTNEQFTKLLFNVTLAASAHAADWPGRRLRVLDPVCGRGTSLNQGLVYGFDVDGIEIDRTAYDAYRTFLVTWLKDKRFKHQVDTRCRSRRDGKVAGRRVEVVFARDKDEYKADDVQRVRLVNDDTTQAGEHYRKPVFDARGRRPARTACSTRAGPSPTRRTRDPRRARRRRARRLDRRDEARRRDRACRGTPRCWSATSSSGSCAPARPRAGATHEAVVRTPRRPRDHARPRRRGEAVPMTVG